MPDSFDQNAQDVGLSLDMIEEEIEAGLPMHADRLVEAFDCEEYYACRNAPYVPRREGEEWRDYVRRPKRTSKLTSKVIKTLAKGLYNPGPTRRLKGNAAADAFLQDVYARNHVNALMNQADRKATLNGFAAIQAHATGRPEKPVILYLWGAHEIVAWTWPDDPTEAWAVVTVTRERRVVGMQAEQRVRYDAWSRDEHRAYRSRWQPAPIATLYVQQQYRGLFGQPARFVGDLSGEPAGSGKNPYGVLPFSFVHNEFVVGDFYAGGIGTPLRECNAEIDRELSDLAQHTREFMNPDRFLRGVSTGWRREKAIDRWQHLVPGKDSQGEASIVPEAFLVQAELATEQVWYNATTYANTTLEELEVPLVAVHNDASTDLSGIAVVAKHIPLLDRTRERQPLFTSAEADLASMVLMVAGSAYGQAALTAAAAKSDLEILWPTPRFPLPTPERDAQDKWELDEGAKSLVDVVAERKGLTDVQAREVIERVAEDNRWLATVLPPPQPAEPRQDPNQPGPEIDPTDQQDTDE
jgi:hypothetical protein